VTGVGKHTFFFSTFLWKLKRSHPQISMIMRELSLGNNSIREDIAHKWVESQSKTTAGKGQMAAKTQIDG
jgi:hypothetical protein